jgi:hypothetical protein
MILVTLCRQSPLLYFFFSGICNPNCINCPLNIECKYFIDLKDNKK